MSSNSEIDSHQDVDFVTRSTTIARGIPREKQKMPRTRSGIFRKGLRTRGCKIGRILSPPLVNTALASEDPLDILPTPSRSFSGETAPIDLQAMGDQI